MKKYCSAHKVLLTDETMYMCIGIRQFHIYISMQKSTSPQNTKDICELLKLSPDLTSVTTTTELHVINFLSLWNNSKMTPQTLSNTTKIALQRVTCLWTKTWYYIRLGWAYFSALTQALSCVQYLRSCAVHILPQVDVFILPEVALHTFTPDYN